MRNILTILSLLLIFGCSSNNVNTNNPEVENEKTEVQNEVHNEVPKELSNEIGTVDVEKDLKLNDLYLYMPYSELANKMGPEKTKSEPTIHGKDEISFNLEYDDGTVIRIFNDFVSSIEVVSDQYTTPRGLKVGDTKEKVVELYQQPEYRLETEWQYANERGGYILQSIYFETDTVVKIKVNLVM